MGRVALRRHLFLLAIAGVLPLAALAGAGLAALFHQQRDDTQRRAAEVTRALATAVDAELRRSFSALDLLGTARSLDRDDMAAFDEAARRVLRSQSEWLSVILADPTGEERVNTRYTLGEKLPRIIERGSFDAAVASGKPRMGFLAQGTRERWAVPIRAPVAREGRVRYVLTAVIDPDAFVRILASQGVPEDWTLSIFDGHGLRVARSRAHGQFVGTPASPSLQQLMASGGVEGSGVTRTLEGDEGFTAYVRLPAYDWSIALSIPVSTLTGAAVRSVAIYALAISISILIGLGAAFFLARRVNLSMARLRDAAQRLGRGELPAAPATGIREIHEVGEAIAAAAEERAAFEAERDLLLRREQAARGEAEAASRAKDQFLAMLGHELRNPLAALSNAASLLESGQADARMTARARQVIQRQVGHLARLTDDILEAARAILGKIELRSQPLDLAAIAAQTLDTLAATGRTTKHNVVSDLHEAWIEGDAVRLEQVASNLIVNAVKYTPAGGTIRVHTGREGGESVLRVADNGVGMPPELAVRAFDLFVQGERELDRVQGGLGIGLTLVRRLAELHGGTATVASEGENRGSEFMVRMPSIERPRLGPLPVPAQASPDSRLVLIVEDNDDARETLQALLELMGHRVVAARDGSVGLDQALAIGPDVALVDLGLPGMDGYEFARRVRAAGIRRIRLVALTGYGAREDRERALAAGFDAHVTKPVQPDVLRALLTEDFRAAPPSSHAASTSPR